MRAFELIGWMLQAELIFLFFVSAKTREQEREQKLKQKRKLESSKSQTGAFIKRAETGTDIWQRRKWKSNKKWKWERKHKKKLTPGAGFLRKRTKAWFWIVKKLERSFQPTPNSQFAYANQFFAHYSSRSLFSKQLKLKLLSAKKFLAFISRKNEP